MTRFRLLFLLLIPLFLGCTEGNSGANFAATKTFKTMTEHANSESKTLPDTLLTATFGAGCFWCTEAQFQQLKGVASVESGYMGGSVDNPSYAQVCTGTTGHAEVTNVYYHPDQISYEELLAAFWTTHDPTQLNRQGNDVGTQYRSIIFYHNEAQKALAAAYKQKLNDEHAFNAPIVTEIAPASKFFVAENYHQNYYNQNENAPYCQFVVRPKLDKFRKVFAGKLKDSE